MATAVIIDKKPGKAKIIEPSSLSLKFIEQKEYPAVIRINDILPFRISFTNITVPGYGPNNIPGIGLQVIGYSNYIL